MRNATLIYNPIAGRKPRRREHDIQEAGATLEAAGIAVKLTPTTGPGTAASLARTAVDEGQELILVCGGDGTINEVINGMTPGRATLGILPGGTANIIAQELGLPADPVRAAHRLPFWSPRRIALGRASWGEEVGRGGASPHGIQARHRYFLSVAGAGFDAYVVYKLSTAVKLCWGVLAYAGEALRQAARYGFPLFTCEVDGRPLAATFATIQRTKRYGGMLRMAPRADVFAPRFELCLFPSRHRARWIVYVLAILTRQHHRLRDVQLLPGHRVVCQAAKAGTKIYFELDGELAGTLPATFEVIPEALSLLVP